MTERKFVCTAEDLKKIRKITGLTQGVFAREIGLAGASAISMIERGRSKPSGSTWFAVQKRFGHLFEIQDRDGVQYIEPVPQPAPQAHDNKEAGAETNERRLMETALPPHIAAQMGKKGIDQEKFEQAVFNMLKKILRSSNEKAKTEVLGFIIMWRDMIAENEEKTE